MTDAETSRAEEALNEKLDPMAERTEDFCVPLRDKIFAALAILAAIVLLCPAGAGKEEIRRSVPKDVRSAPSGSFVTTISSAAQSEFSYSSVRSRTPEKAGPAALAGLISFAAATLLLLAPRRMWRLAARGCRLFYSWDAPPSSLALPLRRAGAYLLFAAGASAVLYGFYQLSIGACHVRFYEYRIPRFVYRGISVHHRRVYRHRGTRHRTMVEK